LTSPQAVPAEPSPDEQRATRASALPLGSAGTDLLGFTEPSVFTAPLRPLTRETSLGFKMIDFADEVLGEPLMPWQRWLAIHALETLPNGRLRFKTILVLVARQNGKSHFARVLVLFAMFIMQVEFVMGTAQTLGRARKLWESTVKMVERSPWLREELGHVRRANGQETMPLVNGSEYEITASNESAGRGATIDLLLCDELREMESWKPWGALSKTTAARPNSQIWGLSNAGEDKSIVLNNLIDRAMAGDEPTLAMFGWIADTDRTIDDPVGWQQANPALGITLDTGYIRNALATDPPAIFRTEVLCQRVDTRDGAIDMNSWRACYDPAGTLGDYRGGRMAWCVDVAPDDSHVALVGAALTESGTVRVEVIAAWDSVTAARAGISMLVYRGRPTALAWYPNGPAAQLGTDLRSMLSWLAEQGVPEREQPSLISITGASISESCMELASLVSSRSILQPNDPLINTHLSATRKLPNGDGWRFMRRDAASSVDAAYALAGAVHTVRNLPAPKPALVPEVV